MAGRSPFPQSASRDAQQTRMHSPKLCRPVRRGCLYEDGLLDYESHSHAVNVQQHQGHCNQYRPQRPSVSGSPSQGMLCCEEQLRPLHVRIPQTFSLLCPFIGILLVRAGYRAAHRPVRVRHKRPVNRSLLRRARSSSIHVRAVGAVCRPVGQCLCLSSGVASEPSSC